MALGLSSWKKKDRNYYSKLSRWFLSQMASISNGKFEEKNGVEDHPLCNGEQVSSKGDQVILEGDHVISKPDQALPKDATPFFDIEINDEGAFDGARKLLRHLRSNWLAEDISFTVFTEGYTNKLIACMHTSDVDSKRDVILVRVYGRGSELLIDRDRERWSMLLLHSIGSAARLYCRFGNGIAYGYTPGTVLSYKQALDTAIERLVAQELVRVHSVDERLMTSVLGSGVHFDPKPTLFTTLHHWLQLIPDSFADSVKQAKFQAMSASKAYLKAEVEGLHDALAHCGSPIVLCHNDLLFKNIIYNAQLQKITFIDFEYMSFNYQAFDIANHFCEFAGMETIDFSRYPDRAYQLAWLRYFLEYYFVQQGKHARDVTEGDVEKLYVQVNKFALAAHLFWSFWALVQASVSNIDYDYIEFASLKLSEYRRRKDEFLALQAEI